MASNQAPLDPKVATRAQFTSAMLDTPAPPNANAEWSRLFEDMKRLLGLLAHHDAMKDNLEQPYMQPAHDKNIVYFMWDFIGRTFSMLTHLDPTKKPASSPRWSDIAGRLQMAGMIIQDKTGRMGAMMGAGNSTMVPFGSEIEEAAKACTKA